MPTLGSTILRLESVTSTNDIARDLAVSGSPEGCCVVAKEQTAGRGRQGHSWSSPPGEGLYFSLVLRPTLKAADSAVLTLAAAVAVAETLKGAFQLQPDIKWPNDLLVSGRKVSGILVESAIEGDRLQYAVMGIGINVAQSSFPSDIVQSATSITLETSRAILPDDVLNPLLERLEHWYRAALSQPKNVIARWEQLSSYARGCDVRVESSSGPIHGVTRGLSPGGALIVELASGQLKEIVSGEVSLRAVRPGQLSAVE